jgi:dienelactone hydrolase
MRRMLFIFFCACQPDIEQTPIRPTVVAEFNPTATPPVVPTPTDLAFLGGDGKHLNVPDLPADSPAQRRFNAFLNTLDGFPAASIASTRFSAQLNAATVTSSNGGSVLVFDLTTGMPLDAFTATLEPDGVTIRITPAQRWAKGHRFAVLVFGGSDPAGVQGAGGQVAVASPTFFLLRAARPLVALCPDPVNPACVCGPDVTPCHSLVAGVDDATAQAAETQRRALDPLLTQLVPAGRSRNDVVLAWTFTITTAPETVFDPASGQIPFPNDILIDPATGLVNLPIPAGDPMAALKMQLNTLDGFSTSAPITAPLDLVMGATLDQASLVPGRAVSLLNLDPRGGMQAVFSTQSPPTGPISVTPIDALQSDQDKYAMFVTSQATAGGQPIRPAPAMFFVTGPDPLVDNGRSTVSVLDDAQAAQLEQLRVALQPLITQLGAFGIPSESLAAITVFTTQSIVRPLAALAQFPAMEPLPTSVTITATADKATLTAKQPQLLFPAGNLDRFVLGTFTSEVVIDPTSGQIQFTRTPSMPEMLQADRFRVAPPPSATPMAIPFWLSLPKKPASPAGAPVVILQHGLGGWRGDMVIFADAFAKLGWAAIAFDSPVHGARALCMSDDQCMGGCDQTTHQCNGGFVAMPQTMDPLACSLEPISGSALDCNPVASGAALVGPNLFLTRSIGQQYVLDAAQMVRVISDAGLPGIDHSRIAFLGVSLGAIGGTLLQAVSPQPATSVLVVGGGHLFEIFSQGSLSTLLVPLLMAQNITPGTPQFAQLQATADWILDAADPFSLGPVVFQRPVLPAAAVAQKHLILQVAGMDTTIPTRFQIDLQRQLFGDAGLDEAGHPLGRLAGGATFSTFFADATHGTFQNGMPEMTAAAMRAQALTFIVSSGTAQ